MRLTDIAVKNAKPSEKPTKISDGKGLYLLVHANGSADVNPFLAFF